MVGANRVDKNIDEIQSASARIRAPVQRLETLKPLGLRLRREIAADLIVVDAVAGNFFASGIDVRAPVVGVPAAKKRGIAVAIEIKRPLREPE